MILRINAKGGIFSCQFVKVLPDLKYLLVDVPTYRVEALDSIIPTTTIPQVAVLIERWEHD